MSIQNKVWDIYSFIKDNLYLCRDDIKFRNIELNSVLLMGLLTAVNGGKELIFGEYGLGKTTSSEQIISLVYGYPKEVVLASTLKGNPEQTEEKMVGRPNLGKLNQGEEKVVWSYFVKKKGPKIVDELNRIPPSKQNILLEGVDRGVWKYLNEVLQDNDLTIYGISNYRDEGNTELIAPLLDRFDVAVEARHPGINYARLRWVGNGNNILSNKDISMKMFDLMSSDSDSDEISVPMDSLRDEYKRSIKTKVSLELLADEDLRIARQEISNIPLSKDAKLFHDLYISELTSCQVFGQKRSNENCKDGCHYKDYLCGKVNNCMSMRTDISIKSYSAAMAWMVGSSVITPEHISLILPYALWHKTKFKKEYVDKFSDSERESALMLHVALQATEELKKRFSENKNMMVLMADAMYKNDMPAVTKILQSTDHPVYRQYAK